MQKKTESCKDGIKFFFVDIDVKSASTIYPFVIDADGNILLKAIIPSRKAKEI